MLAWRRCSAAAALLAAMLSPAFGQSGADFYKGKTVTYIVATSPGGGYDTYGRLVAEYMQRYLPGSTFVVRNMPGAGHMIGTNAIYASRPDGLTIGTFNTGLIYNQLIRHDAVRFDLEKMSWVGKAAYEPRIMAIATQSPIRTYPDLVAQKQPVNFAAAGIGSAAYVETVMLTVGAEAADQDPHRLQRQRRHAGDAARRGGRHDLGALDLGPVRGQRRRPLHRADRRQRDRRAAARPVRHRSGRTRPGRADPDPVRHLAPDRRPARHSGRPDGGAARRLPQGDGGQGAARQDREARACRSIRPTATTC